MEASVNAFHPPRLSFSSPFLPSLYVVPTSAISVLLASRRGHHPRSVHSLDATEDDVSEKGSIDSMENLRGARKGREGERESGREEGEFIEARSRWLIPKEIIEDASPRFHVRIQIGPLEPRRGPARMAENGGEEEVRACTERRCTGATGRASERGNCRLLGPPGALRHHKAYATAIVPVLKPTPRTRPCDSLSSPLLSRSAPASTLARQPTMYRPTGPPVPPDRSHRHRDRI